jgi:hypothetical protein
MGIFVKMFSSDKTSSYGRFASFLALVCLLIWGSLIVAEEHKIPELPIAWWGLVCTTFGISKIGDVAITKKED